MGDFRKYPYHTMHGFHILTPLLLYFPKKHSSSMPSGNSYPASSVQIFHLFVKPFGTASSFVKRMLIQFGLFTLNYFKRLLLFGIAGYWGSHYVSRNSGRIENDVFFLMLFNRWNLLINFILPQSSTEHWDQNIFW